MRQVGVTGLSPTGPSLKAFALTESPMFDSQDELLRRIHTDVMDGYDEELEMEMEDRVDESQDAEALKGVSSFSVQ